MNKVILCGHLTRNIELYNGTNTAVAKSAIAVINPLSDDVQSMPLVASGETAQLMRKKLSRDSKVLIEGQLMISDTAAVAVLVEHFYFPGDQFDTTA